MRFLRMLLIEKHSVPKPEKRCVTSHRSSCGCTWMALYPPPLPKRWKIYYSTLRYSFFSPFSYSRSILHFCSDKIHILNTDKTYFSVFLFSFGKLKSWKVAHVDVNCKEKKILLNSSSAIPEDQIWLFQFSSPTEVASLFLAMRLLLPVDGAVP